MSLSFRVFILKTDLKLNINKKYENNMISN